jgi:hypothetical protein
MSLVIFGKLWWDFAESYLRKRPSTLPGPTKPTLSGPPLKPNQTLAKTMNCRITRFSNEETQTKGTLTVYENGKVVYECQTLELPWKLNERNLSCIPGGTYQVEKHVSPRFGLCFHVLDVPGRTHILIHAGNYAGSRNPRTGVPDTLGCILPGKGFADLDGDKISEVTASKKTMDELLDLLPDRFTLEILTKR